MDLATYKILDLLAMTPYLPEGFGGGGGGGGGLSPPDESSLSSSVKRKQLYLNNVSHGRQDLQRFLFFLILLLFQTNLYPLRPIRLHRFQSHVAVVLSG